MDMYGFVSQGGCLQNMDLEIVSFEELKNNKLCPGDLYYKRKSGKFVCLLSSGSLVTEQFVEKYTSRGIAEIYLDKICDDLNIQRGVKLFTEFKACDLEEDKIKLREDILNWFFNIYILGEREGSFLDVVTVGMKVFMHFEDEFLHWYQDQSIIIYNRSCKIASMSAVMALMLGYNDFNFLLDLYHITFLLDFGLIKDGISYNVMTACEKERECIGAGQIHLEAHVTHKNEIEQFLNHPARSVLESKKFGQRKFNYPELIDFIKIHHENRDGFGFPIGLNQEEIADWESIPMLLDCLFSYDEIKYKKNDGTAKLLGMINKLIEDEYDQEIPCRRLISRIFMEKKSRETAGIDQEIIEEEKQEEEEEEDQQEEVA